MNNTPYLRRRQKAVVFVGLLLFELLLIFIQIWLLVMVLETLLAGPPAMVTPAAAASLVILAVNIWMMRGVMFLDRSK